MERKDSNFFLGCSRISSSVGIIPLEPCDCLKRTEKCVLSPNDTEEPKTLPVSRSS